MDIIYEIRRRHLVQKQTITEIARDMGLSRPTVRKHLNTLEEPKYARTQPAAPKLGQFEEQLTRWLEVESSSSLLGVLDEDENRSPANQLKNMLATPNPIIQLMINSPN